MRTPNLTQRVIVSAVSTAALTAILPIVASALLAQEPEPPPPGPPPGLPCAEVIHVELHGEDIRQGALRVLEVRLNEPVDDLRVTWATQALHFWHDKADPMRRFALVAADLALDPNRGRINISAVRASGDRFVCTRSVDVTLGEFKMVHSRVDRLRVNRRFVELGDNDVERSKRESKLMREIFATVTPERYWTGPFHPPLRTMQPRGNFGRRRVFNGEPRAPHTGEDLRASLGTSVYAPQSGKIVLAKNLFFAGNTVIVDHGLGLYTFFAHLSAFNVKEGDMVRTGQRLGRVGATGRVTGAHLHWSARLGEARFNPLQLLDLKMPEAAGPEKSHNIEAFESPEAKTKQ